MDSFDDSYLLTGHEPKNYDLMETYVESFTESLTRPQFSEQRFLEDVKYDDTALEDYASRSTPSTRLSLPARRLVCRSVVVVHVRVNGATCWTNWSGVQ